MAKLVNTHTGDALSLREQALQDVADRRSRSRHCRWPSSHRPRPTSTRWAPRSPRLLEEDPSVTVERQTETGEQLLWAQGENHVAVTVERLKRKFGAAVVTHSPRIPYRETIRSKTQAEGRHKKQTGGRGQFGHVWLEIEPNPGDGVTFETRVVGGSVPRQFWSGIEKGVHDVADKGPVAGYPVIDFKATLYDGSFHTVDSDELSFRLAGQLATRKGIQDSSPVLLEPIMDVQVRVPEAYMGDVNRDLNTRRGRVLGMDQSDGAPGRARARAAGRAVQLRDRAALAVRRPWLVQGHPRSLRGSAVARGAEGHRPAQEGRGSRALVGRSASHGLARATSPSHVRTLA